MRFQECREGDYRIYAGALEAPHGTGYTAALVVTRTRAPPTDGAPAGTATPPREAFRDDCLSCGHRWRSADDALRHAVARARGLIRAGSPMLLC